MRARSSVVIPQIGIAMGFLLQIRMSCARFRKGVGAGAGVVVLGAGAVSWLSARFKTGGGAGRVLAPLPVLSAGKARRRWCQLVVCAVEAP